MMMSNESSENNPLYDLEYFIRHQNRKIRSIISRIREFRAQAEAVRKAWVGGTHRYLVETRLGIMRPRHTTEGRREEVEAAFRANPYRANVLANIAAQRRALASSDIGKYFSAEDATQENTRQSAIDDAVSQRIAREERINTLRDRLRQFRWGTKLSGFGRYVKAEAASNAAVDERNAESERAQAEAVRARKEEADFNRRINLRASLNRRSEMLQFAKEFPAFFRNTKMSTKDIRDMSKTLKGMSRIPLIGGMLRMNPVSMAATGILIGSRIADAMWANTQKSNLAIESYKAQIGFGGAPSKEILLAGARAGISKESIAQAYARTNMRYGGQAEMVYRDYARRAQGKDPFTKMWLARAYNLSDQEAMMASELGRQDENISDAQINLESKEVSRAVLDYITSSNASFLENVRGYFTKYFPFAQTAYEKDLTYRLRDYHYLRERMPDEEAARIVGLTDHEMTYANLAKAKEAALSGADFDRRYGGAQTIAPTQFYPGESGKRISFYIQNMDVNANDAEGFAESLGKEAGKRGGREVIEAFDTKEL